MRYIMVAFWSVLVGAVVSYVLTSMANEPFVISDSLILSAFFAVFIILMGDVVLKEKKNG